MLVVETSPVCVTYDSRWSNHLVVAI